MQLGASPTGSDRVVIVDILRAFALFGIVINHSAMAFLAGPPPKPNWMTFSSLDAFVSEAVRLLTFGKFFAIFSFLFGLSFAIQLHNAAQKETPFSGRFTWRLLILLMIGFVHSLFFSGDILIIYALLGFLLIPVQRVRSSTLAMIAAILILNIPGALLGLSSVNQTPSAERQQLAAQAGAQFVERSQRQFNIKKAGTTAEVLNMNLNESLMNKLTFQIVTGRLWITYGLFLLGLCAGRMGLFRDSESNRSLMRRVLLTAGTAAAITTIISVVAGPISMRPQTTRDVLLGFSFSVQQASLAAFFVAGLTLLFWKNPSKSVLSKLAPLGKMGLTTYLLQSVFGLLVFYGFGLGLMGELGVTACVALAIGFYVVQVFIARYWLSHFQLGPVEWLWRSLTYFKIQPNSRRQVSAA